MESDNKNSSKPSVFVDSITFNNGETISLNHDDIVVFVGPNNAGKSQSLKDIFSLLGYQQHSIVVTDIEPKLYNNENVTPWLSSFSTFNPRTSAYFGLNFAIQPGYLHGDKFNADVRSLRDLFAVSLKTEQRLAITKPAALLPDDNVPNHPIHFIKKYPYLRIKLSRYVSKAFGVQITPGFDSLTVPLYIGGEIRLEGEFKDEQARLEEYRKQLTKLPVLHEQGDGMRSFTGILLYLLMPHYSCFFIDEPESFLHPPQARTLGEILIEAIPRNSQVFLATHSQELLSGLISRTTNRLKIIRVTREGDKNNVHLLSNDTVSEIANDVFLYYSGIFNGLFHESVVICESESDCRLYSLILDHLKKAEQKPNNTLFLHCSGKHRLAKTAKILKSMAVNFRVIVDIDIFDNATVVKNLYEECGGLIDAEFDSNYKRVIAGVDSLKKPILLSDLKEKIKDILNKYDGQKQLTAKEIEEIRKVIRFESAWSQIKRSGFYGFPQGVATKAAKTLIDLFKNVGIYVVPVGELEGFAKEIEGHGPTWVETLLERHPDLSDDIYSSVKSFIKDLNL